MRIVVYDVESLEAITVISLPITDKDIRERNRHWRVPVVEQFNVTQYPIEEEPSAYYSKVKCVDLWFEPFVRGSYKYGEQHAWICFTKTADLAMLLDPAWLPGQAPTVADLIDCCKDLSKLITRMME